MYRLSGMFMDFIENYVGDLFEEEEVKLASSPDNLSERFNFHDTFEYAVIDDEVYIKIHKTVFRTFEYYLGMEYDDDCIVFRMEDSKNIHLVYRNSDRLLSILDI